MPQTLFDKIWNDHIVATLEDGQSLLYIDRHLVQEVSSPQAFEGLKQRGARVRRPERHIAVADHAVTTIRGGHPARGSLAALQLERLRENVAQFDIPYIEMDDPRHGIVHVIGPELGFSLPGTTLVCGDSHTSTHGALGVLAFGIGTSQCETVLASQCIAQRKPKNMRVNLQGTLPGSVDAKDLSLFLISQIGTEGGQGHAIEFAGEAVSAMDIEARMTLCNMAIEAGARFGMVAPDDKTFAYLKDRPLTPKGEFWAAAQAYWETLPSDQDAQFDREITLDVADLAPHVTWGTTPADALPIDAVIPDPAAAENRTRRSELEQALRYMDLEPGTRLTDIAIDRVFIGSCTNSRIEDLRSAAEIVRDRKVHSRVAGMIVPGSAQVQAEAEAEGLDIVFMNAGFEWRNAGCSMCVAMNEDRAAAGERCASTSNRNFEGRQGPGSKTHLMSPRMAAAAAISGSLADVRAFREMENA